MLKLTGFIFLLIAASPPLAMGGGGAVTEHWKRPIMVAPSFSAKDLHPESCGACHKDQLKDWSGSLHSRSMGPGLLFQLDPELDPETALACYFCHAPLTVQNEIIRKNNASGTGPFLKNRAFVKRLKLTGVSCGVCHLRGGNVTGPVSPKLKGLKEGVKANHGSQQEAFFGKAEFCAACHQLKEGFRLNGRLLVNTYREWKESAYGRNGIVCQNCHMPGRRHLFRGIHDPAMTRSGITIEVTGGYAAGAPVARLTITNTGTGHYFPTYSTPLVVIKGYIEGSKGRIVKGTSREAYIGRRIALDLSEEIFDTRIAPLASFIFDYPLKETNGTERLVFEATVYPDEFYNRFYEYFLTQKTTALKKRQIEAAHKKSSTSSYELFRKEISLKDLAFPMKKGL